MISEIHIADWASYGQEKPQTLTNLKTTNFIYGSNGTGKTVISQVIAKKISSPCCQIKWQGEVELETLVYNRFFVKENFEQSSELKGIFTLGKEDKDVLDKIAAAKTELDALSNSIQELRKTLEGEDGESGKRSDLSELEAGFCGEVLGT